MELGWGQALLTLAVVLSLISGALLAVWCRHRSQGHAAPFTFPWPHGLLGRLSTHRGTYGSGRVGGGQAGAVADERSERLLPQGAQDSSAGGATALRNRPGGHSLV